MLEVTNCDCEAIDGGGFGDYIAYGLGYLYHVWSSGQKAANDVDMPFMAI